MLHWVPPKEFRSDCVSVRGQEAGYYWFQNHLHTPEDKVIAAFGESLCPTDGGPWATTRTNKREAVGYIATNIIAAGNDLDEVKRLTEEWLIDNPDPPR